MRLDKLLSECGLASRKEAAGFAKGGRITVNGEVERSISRHIDPERDTVTFCGERVLYRPFTYIMLHKPQGYISATEDGRLPVVTELLSPELQRLGLFPSGRLDRDTVGLMILTNDGVLSHRLLSPRRHVEKVYAFRVDDPIPPNTEEAFLTGITIGENEICKPARLSVSADRLSGEITLTEGKYHQIKRMMLAVGTHICYLSRLSFGGVRLDPALKCGEYRHLTEDEVALLRSQA